MYTMQTVVELSVFARSAQGVFSSDEVMALIDFLSCHPKAGDVIQGSGGLRKLRWQRGGMGKRGGARVIYYHYDIEGKVYLLMAYAKSVQENLTAEQLKRLKEAMG
jgi:hypothetical protein